MENNQLVGNPEKWFKLADGRILKTLDDLIDTLGKMDDSVFHSHVNDERNDFATWVYDVFGEKELSRKMSKCLFKQEMVIVVRNHLNKFNNSWRRYIVQPILGRRHRTCRIHIQFR